MAEANIYTTNCYDYILSVSDRIKILNSIASEFNVTYETKDGNTTIFTGDRDYKYGKGLWLGNPMMSNIKYVVESLGFVFIGSKTDKLCTCMHNAYIHAYEAKMISMYMDDPR